MPDAKRRGRVCYLDSIIYQRMHLFGAVRSPSIYSLMGKIYLPDIAPGQSG
jgi:hypothetical protein